MNSLKHFCFLCLADNENITFQNNSDSKVVEELNYFIPGYLLPKSDIPKHICGDCLTNLSNIYKFRHKCLENIMIFNDYVQNLTEHHPFKCLYHTESDPQNNIEVYVKANGGTKTKRKITEAENHNLLRGKSKKISEDNEYVEQTQIKQENTTDDYLGQTEESSIMQQVLIKVENIEEDISMEREINEEIIIKEDLYSYDNGNEHMSEDEHISGDVPANKNDAAKNVSLNSLPEKSRSKYERQYKIFNEWYKRNNIKKITENVLLEYFLEKSEHMTSSSLWSIYSMLRATIVVKNDLNIGKFNKLTAFLKQKSVGYKAKKSKTFSRKEIEQFLIEAPDEQYLMMKVALIIGVAGACRRDELVRMTTDDIIDQDSLLEIQIPDSRTFTITSNNMDLISFYRKYISLRPSNVKSRRLFVKYNAGYCTNQHVGMNTIAKIPQIIAQYLKLPEPNEYSGHCFRRTYATLLAEAGGDVLSLKKHHEVL